MKAFFFPVYIQQPIVNIAIYYSTYKYLDFFHFATPPPQKSPPRISTSPPFYSCQEPALHQWKAHLFSFQMMYKSQFQKIDHYDWFCGPGRVTFVVTLQRDSNISDPITESLPFPETPTSHVQRARQWAGRVLGVCAVIQSSCES